MYWSPAEDQAVRWSRLSGGQGGRSVHDGRGGPSCPDGFCGPLDPGMASQGAPGCQVIRVVMVATMDDMLSENIWFSGSNSSNYRGKLRCHSCDGRTEDGKWKIEQCSVRPETVICVVLGLLLLLLLLMLLL